MAEATREVSSPPSHVEGLTARIEAGLADLNLPPEPPELYDPIRYVLAGGGKRLRPVLVLLAAEATGGSTAKAMSAALAVEVFHNFTLVHDDIMDRAPERRGRPTVHVKWSSSAAILSGDLMMGIAYRLIAEAGDRDAATLVARFHEMVVAVCEGQALDDAFENRDAVSLGEYLDMIHRKTGALIECALDIGARISGADEATCATLAHAGRKLGRAFQIQDDLLDLTASDPGWGKTIGGDLVAAKKTYLLVRALELTDGPDREWFDRIGKQGGLAPELVGEARQRMARAGVLDEAAAEVRRHSESAMAALATLPPTDARETLTWLADRLSSRSN